MSRSRSSGRSTDAARWLAQQASGSFDFREAAVRFGVSRQAVQQAWHHLGLGETPREKLRRQLQAAVMKLARDGKTATEVSQLTGVSPGLVYAWCRRQNVKLARGHALHAADPKAVAVGLAVVRAGGTIAEGACAAGIQYAAFQRYLKRANIKPSHSRRGKRHGASAQAALLVEREGISVNEAAKLHGIAPRSVYDYIKRHP